MTHTEKNGGGARDAILRAALKMISRLGYAASSVATIAKEAGVNNVTVYRLFTNKENLFREVIKRFSDVRLDDALLDAELEKRGGDIESALESLASAYFGVIFRNVDIIRIFIVEAPHFDFVAHAAWYMPPDIVRHCGRCLARLESGDGADDAERGRAVEMFVAHIVRRAMEYNKHDSIWEFTPELVNDFMTKMRPQIALLARLLRAPVRAG